MRLVRLALFVAFAISAFCQGQYPPPSGSGGTPGGSAGGDLGGTYPNPSVLKVNGVAVSTLTGIVKFSGGTVSNAAYADVVSLFGSGSCTGLLKSDGTCFTNPTFPSGAIVGTTDTQTLTNKTISSTQITGLGSFALISSLASTNLSDTTVLVRTTDTASVTNSMLFGSIANNKLANSSITIAGHSVSLGGTQTLACADLSNASASCATDATNATNISSGTLAVARGGTGAATVGGGTVFGNASGATAAPSFTVTPTLGIAGTSTGTLSLAGVTSGTVTITPQSTAGTPTITLPNASGTAAVSASSPLALNSTTGNATCTTCATTTNGGALSATAPEAISAGGVISTTNTTAYDNSIVSSSVDASGNPNYLGTAGNTVLPINGGTTSLVMYIAGLKQTLNSNVTLTLPTTASVQQWILVKQDTGNANMVAGDFLGMNTAPFYGYAAPTCPSPSPALSATNPAFWFDMSTGLSKLCTSNAGSYAASPAIVLGVVNISVTPAITFALSEPFRLSPLRRVELFGSGVDGALTVTSGTTTLDNVKQYTSAVVTGGTVNHTASSGDSYGITWKSQNPVLIVGGTITAKGLGRGGPNGGTGAGSNGNGGGLGGAGGGGGGSGTTSAAGGTGGGHLGGFNIGLFSANGGSAGSASPTAGGNGTASNVALPFFANPYSCSGAPGGAGAGDGTHAGGGGGAAGGSIWITAPSILVASGVSVIADGNDGAVGSAANAGGGGGGGGGCVILNAGFISSSGATITASAGAVGAKGGAGTGTAGGTGGAGLVQQNRLW